MEFKNVKVTDKTHERLAHISRMTNISMSKIIEQITDAMICLVAGNYPKATFKVLDMVTEDSVIITIHTYPKNVTVGSFKLPSDVPNSEVDKILSEKTFEKINKDLKEDFGEK